MVVTGARERDLDRRRRFEALVSAELTPAHQLASRVLADPCEAEDVVHEAVIRAWDALDDLRTEDRFGAWFGRIVVNLCRDRLRRRRIVRMERLGDIEPAEAATLDAALATHEVAAALDRLTPEQRIVIVLRYWRDLRVDDIARIVGVPSGTVKWRLHAALRHLKRDLCEEEPR